MVRAVQVKGAACAKALVGTLALSDCFSDPFGLPAFSDIQMDTDIYVNI